MKRKSDFFGIINSFRSGKYRKESPLMTHKGKKSEYLLQRLINAVPIPIYFQDMQGLYRGCNKEFEKYIGLSKEKIIGKPVKDIDVCGINQEYYVLDSDLFKGQAIDSVDDYLGGAKGTFSEVILKKAVLENESGEPEAIVSAILDVTGRKRLEQALNEFRYRQRSILDNIPDIAWLKDTENRYVVVNKAFSQACGMEPQMVVGKTDFDIWPRNLAEKYWLDDREIMQTGQGKHLQQPMVDGGGNSQWRDIIKTPILDSKGRITGTAGISRDITAHKETEAELRKLRDNLRSLTMEVALAEEKERRRIALELHDHINQNLAYCRIKLSELIKENKSSLLAQSINEVLSIVTETIADTRSLTFELSPPVLYDQLDLEQAIEWLGQKIIAARGINVRLDIDDQLAQIGQELKILLFQIVRELLNNVAKHAQAKEALVFIRKTGDNILIDVQDDGIGFDVSMIADYRKFPIGYGLFSIRERLNHLGGYFDIKSNPGKGTTVSILVPLS
jgi:two-component system, NarL family, sensor histidine kinase UhpB